MKCKYYLFLIISISFLLNTIKSDLPVHCLATKIEGDWLIHMSDNYSDKDLRCGHNNPDQNLDHYEVDVEKAIHKKYETLVHLERPNQVISIKDNTFEIGKWTMVYDEGFEFTIHDQVFFAFNRYKKVGQFSASNTDTEDTPGYKNECDKTFLGWYHNAETNDNWGCFWAELIDKKEISKLNLKAIDYKNIFKFRNIPVKIDEQFSQSRVDNGNSDNNDSDSDNISGLKNNFMKKNPKAKELISMMDEISDNKEKERDSNRPDSIESVKYKHLSKKNNNNNLSNNKKGKKLPQNGPVNTSASDNSYMDFVRSLGWGNSSSNDDNNANNNNSIPNLDIYFMDQASNDSNPSSNFLEVESNLGLKFQPDFDYVSRVNDPKNGYKWTAKVYDDFVGKTYSQMRSLLGNVNFLKTDPFEESSNKEAEQGTDFLELGVDVST